VFAALEVFGEPSSRELKNKSNGSMKAVSMIFNILFGPPDCWLGSEESSNTSHNQAGEVKKIFQKLGNSFLGTRRSYLHPDRRRWRDEQLASGAFWAKFANLVKSGCISRETTGRISRRATAGASAFAKATAGQAAPGYSKTGIRKSKTSGGARRR